MNVLYDISGSAGATPQSRSRGGIQTVVSELAQKLATSDECDLNLYASEDALSTYEYYKSIPSFHQIRSPIPVGFQQQYILKASNQLRYLFENGQKTGDSTWRPSLAERIKIAWFHRTSNFLQTSVFESHYQQRLYEYRRPIINKAHIYHSPALHLPSDLRVYKNLTFFQTVYDMIPVLFPEMVNATISEWLMRILKNLHPEDWVLTDSQSARNDFLNYSGHNPEKVIVTPLAADNKVFYPCNDEVLQEAVRIKYGIPLQRQYILTLSSLQPRKNLIHTIKSFASLINVRKGLSDVILVLAGGRGWNYDAIFAELNKLDSDIRKRVIITGYVDDLDLAALYSGATAFVFPSLYEGFGLPPLEAMQCGTPVIASNTSSLPEVVGDAGILLDPTDRDGLCQAMWDVISDSRLRAEMGRKSIERAKQFCWSRCAADTIAAYKLALSAPPR